LDLCLLPVGLGRQLLHECLSPGFWKLIKQVEDLEGVSQPRRSPGSRFQVGQSLREQEVMPDQMTLQVLAADSVFGEYVHRGCADLEGMFGADIQRHPRH
jgi:hypothetical protein